MTQQIIKAGKTNEIALSDEDIKTLVSVGIIPAETPPDVVVFFARTCGEMKMSPFKRQIHLIKRQAKVKKKQGNAFVEVYEPRYSIQVGIDGLRSRADSTGCYAGNDDYRFDGGLTEYQMIEAGFTQPETATATVYKVVAGLRCPFTATARWKEYCPSDDKQAYMWHKMSFLMLGKAAESLALRKAFPNETSGVYSEEEMQHVPMEVDETNTAATPEPETPVIARRKPAAVISDPVKNKVPEAQPEAPTEAKETLAPAVDDWRNVVVHYSKHKGKKLGELETKSLRWFWANFAVQESYEKDGKTVQCSAGNIDIQKIFRAALNAAGNELEFVEEPPNA